MSLKKCYSFVLIVTFLLFFCESRIDGIQFPKSKRNNVSIFSEGPESSRRMLDSQVGTVKSNVIILSTTTDSTTSNVKPQTSNLGNAKSETQQNIPTILPMKSLVPLPGSKVQNPKQVIVKSTSTQSLLSQLLKTSQINTAQTIRTNATNNQNRDPDNSKSDNSSVFPNNRLKVFPFIETQVQNTSEKIKLLNNNSITNVSGLIISFHSGNSYDTIFTKVQQKSKQNTTVLVYSCDSDQVVSILSALQENSLTISATLRQLKVYVQNVGKQCPNCVVFNWQCSSGYSNSKFNQGRSNVMNLLKYVLGKGYMAMFSDFSLKALINQWDPEILGPNPLIKIGETSQQISLKYNYSQLLACPSSQLQTVGQLDQSGNLKFDALGGTIIYCVNSTVNPNGIYSINVLTVASQKVTNDVLKSKIDDNFGSAGHIILTYKSGGHLLTSMGHLMEIMKINTSDKLLFQVAQSKYGESYANQLKNIYSSLNTTQRGAFVQKNAINLIQSQSPGLNSAYLNK